MNARPIALAALVGLLAPAVAVAAEVPIETPDLMLAALEDELARAREVKMDGLERPYYLRATLNDEDTFQVSASFGALVARGSSRRTSSGVVVRVGDPALDNTNFVDDEWGFGAGGRGPATPVEPDYDALRRSLWLQFDEGYKKGLEVLAKKRAYLESNQAESRPPDFSAAATSSLLMPRQTLAVDQERWARLVKKASAVFRTHPQIVVGEVAFRAAMGHQLFVSSDPARHRFADPAFEVQITAGAQAADGMELRVRWNASGRRDSDLPGEEALLRAAEAAAQRLEALLKAPRASEDYTGPVLFTGRAASQFFLRTVGDPLSHPRDDLGDARQGRLVDRLGKHIASKVLTARDDPTQQSWKGQALLGYYPIDDDSVRPQPITLIEKGVLKTYYMSRTPTRLVRETNGHCRGGDASVGNLFIEAASPAPRAELKKKLLELAREEDLGYAILVEEFAEPGRFRGGGGGGDGSTLSLPPPAVAWKIYADGRQELVRGLMFKPSSLRMLKEIAALGDDPQPLNTYQRGQHVAVIAPSVLVKTLDLQRLTQDFEKPPLTPRPAMASATAP